MLQWYKENCTKCGDAFSDRDNQTRQLSECLAQPNTHSLAVCVKEKNINTHTTVSGCVKGRNLITHTQIHIVWLCVRGKKSTHQWKRALFLCMRAVLRVKGKTLTPAHKQQMKKTLLLCPKKNLKNERRCILKTYMCVCGACV